MEEEEWFDNKLVNNDFEDKKKIDDDMDAKLEKVCAEFMFYLKEFSTENAIPLGDNLDYVNLAYFLEFNN
jgi:hypothetical protein